MPVKLGCTVFRVRDIDDTQELFGLRFALHFEWTDPYYQGGLAYSNHPEISDERCANFPKLQLSVTGVEIHTDNRPRWTPEIKFFDCDNAPELVRQHAQKRPRHEPAWLLNG